MKTLLIAVLLICGFCSARAQNLLNSSGNVGIGTTSPEAVLQVVNVEQDASAGNTFILGRTDATNLRMGYNTNYSWIQAHAGKPLYINELGNNLILNPTSSDVGIGVFNPTAKLDIRGALTKSIYGIIVPTVNIFTKEAPQIGIGGAIAFGGKTGQPTADYAFAYITGAKENNYDYSGYFAVHTVSGGGANEVSSANYERFRIASNGNVGIGTASPRSALDVAKYIQGGAFGTVLGRLEEGDHESSGTFLGVQGHSTQVIDGKSFSLIHNFYGQTNSSINFFRGQDRTGGFITFNTNNNTERLRINTEGNVGIGTSDPKGYKLAVAGNMIAESIKVNLVGTWPDFVFTDKFQLPSLKETEIYIKQNGTLPGIPNEQEVKANGIDLGEMNAKLLQKIEELTLHVIQLEKNNDQQSKDIEYLKSKIKE